MAKYRCTVCNYVFDEESEGRKFSDLADDWRCPVCNAPKTAFILLSDTVSGIDFANSEYLASVFLSNIIKNLKSYCY